MIESEAGYPGEAVDIKSRIPDTYRRRSQRSSPRRLPPRPSQERAPQRLTLRIDRPIVSAADQYLSDHLPVPYVLHPTPPEDHYPRESASQLWPGKPQGDQHLRIGWDCLGDPFSTIRRATTTRSSGISAMQLDGCAKTPSSDRVSAGIGAVRFGFTKRANCTSSDARQFVTAERAQELVVEGVCSYDDTVSSWIAAMSGRVS